MKRFGYILLGFAALVAAVSVQAMPLGLRMALWNRTAREVSVHTLSAPVITVPATYEAESCTVAITADAGATIIQIGRSRLLRLRETGRTP